MSSSYTKLYVHLMWSTNLRDPSITEAIAPRLHGYLSTRCREFHCPPLAIGGVSDHVHVLVRLSREVAISQLVRELKAPTTRFIHRELSLPNFAWQEGYGAFTLREVEVEEVRRYVEQQGIHHANGSTIEEWERCVPPPVTE